MSGDLGKVPASTIPPIFTSLLGTCREIHTYSIPPSYLPIVAVGSLINRYDGAIQGYMRRLLPSRL